MYRKLLLICMMILLLSCTANAADVVSAVGMSFDQYAGDPGFGVMIGTEFDIDSTIGLKGRFVYVKSNWHFAMDKMTLDGINLYNLPLWNLQLGLHTGGTYETETGNFGFVSGLELRKHLGWDLKVFRLNDIFASGDILFRSDMPDNYFVITIGAVLRL